MGKPETETMKTSGQASATVALGHDVARIVVERASKRSGSAADSLKRLRDLLLILGILAYFVGWMYAFNLLSHFGLSMREADLPVYWAFVYSYSVVAYTPVRFILLFILVGVALWSRERYLRTANVVLLVVGVAVMPLLADAAYKTAVNQAILIRNGQSSKPIAFTFADISAIPAKLLEDNRDGRLRLLFSSPESYIVLRQLGRDQDELPIAGVITIDRALIVSAEVTIVNLSNPPQR